MRNVRRKQVRELAHMQPFGTAEDHALAFCGELAKVRGENGGRDDSAGHDWKIDFQDHDVITTHDIIDLRSPHALHLEPT